MSSIAWDPGGRLLATGGRDQLARLWSADDGQLVATWHGHTAPVDAVAFAPDGSRVATCSRDGSIRLWATGPAARDQPAPVLPLAFPILAVDEAGAAALDGSFRLPPVPFPDSRILTGLADGWMAVEPGGRLLRLETPHGPWEVVTSLPLGTDPQTARVSPDGRWLIASKGVQNTSAVREGVWRLSNTSLPETLFMAESPPGCQGVFSSDSRFLAQAALDGTITLHRLAESRFARVWSRPAHRGIINSLVFSDDSTRLASASSDGTVKVWDVRDTTSPPIAFNAGGTSFWCAAFSPDISRLAAAGDGGKIHLWDLRRQQLVARFRQPKAAIALSLAFAPDDSCLAAAGTGWMHVWEAPVPGDAGSR